jgi:hypothetical protein
LLQAGSVSDVVKDYVAFGIISEIDDILDAIIMTVDTEALIQGADIKFKARKMNAPNEMYDHFTNAVRRFVHRAMNLVY